MADSTYIVEILLKARDEAKGAIEGLRNEVRRLKAEAEGKNALEDLDRGLKETAKDAEAAERGSKRLDEQHGRTGRSAAETGRAHRRMGEDVRKGAQEMRGAERDTKALDTRLAELTQRFDGVRKSVAENNAGFHEARIQAQELGKEVNSLANKYETAGASATRARKAAEDMASFARGVERSHPESRTGGSEDIARQIRDLRTATEQFEAHVRSRGGVGKSSMAPQTAEAATSSGTSLASSLPLKPGETVSQYKEHLAQIREGATGGSAVPTAMGVTSPLPVEQQARSYGSLGRQYESIAGQVGPAHPEYPALMAEGARLRGIGGSLSAQAVEAGKQEEFKKRVDEVTASYRDFEKVVSTGSLTEAEARRGYQDFSRALSSVSHGFRLGTKDAQDFGVMADQAAKKAKEAGILATGGLGNSIKRGDFGSVMEWAGQHLDKSVMPRITGVSSFLRGLKDIGIIAFIQPLATGLMSLAGGFVAVGSAAAQAAAGVAGVFVSGVAQTVPMISVAVAALMRFKDIFQAVSLAGEREKEEYFEPHADQIKSLQLENQMITAHQQLTNSNIALLDAQERVKLSQIALTESRVEAQRKIMQLTIAEKDARLEAEGADISLKESRRQLQIAIEGGNVAGISAAELQVKEAELNKEKAHKEIPYIEREARLARERGVKGAPSVISATEGLRASREAVVQSQQAIAEAQRQLRILQLQSSSPAAHETSTQAQLAFLKSRMSPAARQLTETLTSIFASLRKPDSPLAKMTDYFIAPFSEMAERMKSLLGNNQFVGVMDNLAKAMGASLKQYGHLFFGKEGTSIFETLAKDATGNLPIVTKAIMGLLKLISIIARAANPAFHKLSEDWAKFWDALGKHYGSAQGFATLEAFFNKAAKYAEDFAHLAHVVIDLFIAIARDAAPQGDKTITSFSETIERATRWIESHSASVVKFFREAREGLGQLGGIAFALGKALLEVFSLDSLRAFSSFLQSILIPAARDVLNVFGFIVRSVIDLINLVAPLRVFAEALAAIVISAIAFVKVYGYIKTIITALKEAKAALAAFADSSFMDSMLGPWGILAGAISLAGIAILSFSENTKKAKYTAEELNQVLEDQANAIRTIQGLNNEYKSSELAVLEAKQQVINAENELSKAKREGPQHGESSSEYHNRVNQDELYVQRAKLNYEEQQSKFAKLPQEQEETYRREAPKSRKAVHEMHEQVGSRERRLGELKRELHEGISVREAHKHGKDMRLGGELSASKEKQLRAEIASEERNLTTSKIKLTQAIAEQNKLWKEHEHIVSQQPQIVNAAMKSIEERVTKGMEEASTVMRTNSQKGAEALKNNFGKAVKWVEEAIAQHKAKTEEGMDEITRILARTLKAMGTSPTHLVQQVAQATGGAASHILHGLGGFASGAYVPAQAGGVYQMSEAGHDEVVLTTDPRRAASQRKLLSRYLQKAPHILGSYAFGGYVDPFPGAHITPERIDMGVDYSMTPGEPLAAIGAGRVTGIIPNWYKGQPFLWYQLAEGPDKGRFVYYAEQINPLVHIGQQLRKGQTIARYASSGTGIEAGWATSSGMTLAQATTGYTEGARTAAGQSASDFFASLGAPAGLIGGRPLLGSMKGLPTGAAAISGALSRIKAPLVTGGGLLGAITQRSLNLAALAANRYVEKLSSPGVSGGHFSYEPSGGGGTPQQFAIALLKALGISQQSQAIADLVRWEAQEGGNWANSAKFNPLNTTLLMPGSSVMAGGSGAGVQAYTSWSQGLSATVDTLKNYPTILAALRENANLASFEQIVNASPWGTHFAVGGFIGDHIRRLGVRQLRKSILKFAMGGKAPWGGSPVPIIAHEGERIMNPAQYAEVSRPWGGEKALDDHLGFNSRIPRQSFAAGGHVPRVVGGSWQPMSYYGPHHHLHIQKLFQGMKDVEHILQSVTTEELSSENRLKKIFKAVAKAYKTIGVHQPGFLSRVQAWTETVLDAQSGVLARMAAGLEVFKEKSESRVRTKSYKLSGNKAMERHAQGTGALAGEVVGGAILGSKEHQQILSEEYQMLDTYTRTNNKTANLVHRAMEQAKQKIREAHAHHKSAAGLESHLDHLRASYEEVQAKQRELHGRMTSNIEERFQAESESLQDELGLINSYYQVTSQSLSSRQSTAQSRGNYSALAAIDVQIVEAANAQKARLVQELQKAESIGATEMANQLKTEIIGLETTVASAVSERVQALIQGLQLAYQTQSAELSSKQSIAQSKGRFGDLRTIDAQIVNAAQAQIASLSERLAEAEGLGDTQLTDQIKQEIDGLQTTVATTAAAMIQAAEQQLQQEGQLSQAKQSELSGLSKVAKQRGEYARGGQLESEALQTAQERLLHERNINEGILNQARAEGNTEQITNLESAIDKNTAELEENSQTIKENVVATRELMVQALEKEGQFRKGIYGSALSGYETLGRITGAANVPAMKEAVEGEGRALSTERSGIEGILKEEGLSVSGLNPTELISFLNSTSGQEAIAAAEKAAEKSGGVKGLEAFRANIQALEQNTDASLQNSQKLAELNGQLLQPQSWSTSAFNSFRTSFFNGMGGLLPQYSSGLPPEVQGSLATMPQFKEGPTIENLNITHPVQVLNPYLMGEQLSHAISNAP